MKKKIRTRAKRVKNGTTMWKVTTMNVKTGTTTVRKVRCTYDEITAKVHRVRARNQYNAVCAEEMHKWGGKLKEDGRVVALDSLADEKMFEESVRPKSEDDEDVIDNYDSLT
jgi:hypothetical protein